MPAAPTRSCTSFGISTASLEPPRRETGVRSVCVGALSPPCRHRVACAEPRREPPEVMEDIWLCERCLDASLGPFCNSVADTRSADSSGNRSSRVMVMARRVQRHLSCPRTAHDPQPGAANLDGDSRATRRVQVVGLETSTLKDRTIRTKQKNND
eukprot:6185242-Pleurochrysis_carterae.AAC.3